MVAVRFGDGVDQARKDAVFADLAALRERIEGVLDFRSFRNVSVETHLVRGFEDVFWFDFRDAGVRDAYLVDPEHVAVGGRLAALAGGGDGIFVFDVEV
jgi:hypothetical protein